MTTLQWAEYYLQLGWSVIPLIPGDKKPAIPWEEFQKRRATLKEVRQWFKGSSRNIGVVTGEISSLFVIDIDSKEGEEAIQKTVPVNIRTPVSRTVGGKHLYLLHDYKVALGNNSRLVPGCDARGEGGYVVAPPSHVVDTGKKREGTYSWMLSPREQQLDSVPDSYVSYVSNSLTVSNIAKSMPTAGSTRQLFDNGTRDNDLFTLANTLVKGGMSDEYVSQVLERVIKTWDEGQSELQNQTWINQKIDSAKKRAGMKDQSLKGDVKEWVLSSSGVFMSSDVAKDLSLSSRVAKKNLSKILSRLTDEGLIVKNGKKNGQFRKIEDQLESLAWEKVDISDQWNIKYPFGLEKHYITLPKTITMIDGTTNSGKTAFLMNVAYMNALLYKKKINYFSSEMGPLELKVRIEKYDDPENFKHINFFERSGDFSDVIRPDEINIIDFLELNDEFWKVGEMVRAIHDRLNTGICLIARQKAANQKTGRGGEFGEEKARLVLTMDPGQLRIKKCKNFRNQGENPNGKVWRFKLVQGCMFMPDNSLSRKMV